MRTPNSGDKLKPLGGSAAFQRQEQLLSTNTRLTGRGAWYVTIHPKIR